MINIEIPYVIENKRIEKSLAWKEISVLEINEAAKRDAYAAIYHVRPKGVTFGAKLEIEANLLATTLRRLEVPYRVTREDENYFGQEQSREISAGEERQ